MTCPACGTEITRVARSLAQTDPMSVPRPRMSCPGCRTGPFTWDPLHELDHVTCPNCGNKDAQPSTLPARVMCDACGYGIPKTSKWDEPLAVFGIPGVVLLVLFGFFALFRGVPPPSVAYQRGEPVEIRDVDCVAESWSPRRGFSGSCTATWSTTDGEIRRGGIYGADFEHESAAPGTLEAREYNGLPYLDVGGPDVALDVIFLLVPLVIGAVLLLLAAVFFLRSFFSSTRRMRQDT